MYVPFVKCECMYVRTYVIRACTTVYLMFEFEEMVCEERVERVCTVSVLWYAGYNIKEKNGLFISFNLLN